MPFAKIATEASVRGVATSERMCAREEKRTRRRRRRGRWLGPKPF